MKNPRYANSDGGILIEQDDGVDLYVSSGPLYERIQGGEFGEIADFESEPVSRSELIRNAYQSALAKGAPYAGDRLKITNDNEIDRIGMAALRYQTRGDLPGGKDEMRYPLAGGDKVTIPADDIVDAATAIQDYIEACNDRRDDLHDNDDDITAAASAVQDHVEQRYDRRDELREDDDEDIDKGWPE